MTGRWCFVLWALLASIPMALPAQELAPSELSAVDVMDRPTMNVAIPDQEPGCERSVTTEDIVVCGRRVDTTYRLDSRLVEAQRRVEGARGGPSATERLLVSCSDVSARGCPGQGAVSVSGAALKFVSVLVAAVKGDDWKEPLLSNEPDEYEVYKALAPPDDPVP